MIEVLEAAGWPTARSARRVAACASMLSRPVRLLRTLGHLHATRSSATCGAA